MRRSGLLTSLLLLSAPALAAEVKVIDGETFDLIGPGLVVRVEC